MRSEEQDIAKEITIAIIQQSKISISTTENLMKYGEDVAKLYLTISKAVSESRQI